MERALISRERHNRQSVSFMLAPSRRTATAAALMLASAWLSMGSATAQTNERLSPSFWLRGGVFHARIDSSLRVDYVGSPEYGLAGAGTTLDFEEDLGLPRNQTRGDVLLGVRLFDRGRIELQHYSLRRSGTKQLLDESVVVNGITYSAQAQLTTSFQSDVTRVGLGYSLLKTPTAEAGVLIGVQFTRYRLALMGEGRINNEPPESRSVEESDSGPLPTVGIYGSFALAPNWSMQMHADYLPVDSRRLRGRLGMAELNLYRQLTPNLAAGVGVRHVRYKLDRKSSGELTGRFEYRFTGPQVIVEATF
jgi:hypothetical protein